MRYILIGLSLLVLVAPAFAGESGIQITQQGPTAILVSKDIGGDRWAIAVSLEQGSPFETTGNVFRPDGEPSFLQCRPIDVRNPDAELPDKVVVFNCYGADKCTGAPCSAGQWSFIATVDIPGSFFLP